MLGLNATEALKHAESNVFWKRLINSKYFHELTIIMATIVISIILSFLTPYFLTVSNILTVMQQVSITTIIAFGMAFVIISQGIDLSVGSAISLVGLPMALIVLKGDTPAFLALSIMSGILLGALIGFINGISILYLNIAPFIATLATMSICRGMALTLTNGQPIFGLPESFLWWGSAFIGPVPISVIVMLTVFVIAYYIANYTKFGRKVYAVGGNEEAARLSGINVKRVKVMVYMISGICVGIASVLFTARLASMQPAAGDPYLFNSITSAILGGVALNGGSGTMVGVLLGSILIGVIDNGQALLNINPFVQQVIKGVLVLLAVTTSSLRAKR